ncbi:MAG: DUF4198 domain-containing protein [Desulfovibrio sp.]|nr:MAG: DUF4198 domain-containing protein [Desulfovibrio sp.]
MRTATLLGTVLAIILVSAPAWAHFGMAIPSSDEATPQEKTLTVTFSFSHPMGGEGMELVQPKQAGVMFEGEITDLLGSLTQTQVMDFPAWAVDYTFARPGAYSFFMEPQPYWEPAEDVSIIHYTKVIVPAFGGEEGWDEPVGLPTEIVPLLRPFGNYAGNVFVGQVLIDGAPAPNAEVEVELYNQAGYTLPTAYHETQVIFADENGVFVFACPKAGWWGFAALSEAPYTLTDPDGNEKGVELGAVLWTYMHDYQ